MNIYLAHSTGYDYKKELYAVLKQLSLEDINIYFPHDDENGGQNSKTVIESSDLVLAEVSYPSTGQGIELGWADSSGKQIICIFKSGSKYSEAIKAISNTFIEYVFPEDLIDKLKVKFQSLPTAKSSKFVD